MHAHFAAPLLLFSFPVLAAIEPAFVGPWPLMGPLARARHHDRVARVGERRGIALLRRRRSSRSPRRRSGRRRT